MARPSAVLVRACCALCMALCHEGRAEGRSGVRADLNDPDDALVLLQRRARALERVPAALGGRFEALDKVLGGRQPQLPLAGLYCDAYPELCKPPFNCQNFGITEALGWAQTGFASRGKVNHRFWCFAPLWRVYASKCAAGDLDGAAWSLFHLAESGKIGQNTAELDASYCFQDGHCVNPNVTSSTTVEEGLQLCDERFGHWAWTHYGSVYSPPQDRAGYRIAELRDASNGFTTPAQTRPMMLMACSTGSYHCDVRYCQQTYCKHPYYRNKYGNLLKAYGWTK
uniref:Uncharacterized protein n=1 Tax=Pyrodinium bahamense TaxID=73915 RepID=A0A7S0F7N7_9DINO